MRQEIQLRMERLTQQILAHQQDEMNNTAEVAQNSNPGQDAIKSDDSKSGNFGHITRNENQFLKSFVCNSIRLLLDFLFGMQTMKTRKKPRNIKTGINNRRQTKHRTCQIQ